MTVGILIGALLALATALPLAWKWELGMGRSLGGLIAFAAIAAGVAVLLDLGGAVTAALVWALTVGLAVAVVLWRFYRDPERTAPPGEEAIVSPADGVVIYVKGSEGGEIPVSAKVGRRYPLEELTRTELQSEEAVVIGIALSFLDVHVNRAPIAGRVSVQRHFAGRFGSLKDPEAVVRNERSTTVIENSRLQAAVVLIASRLVRRIVTYVQANDEVALGERIGVIRFGSQVDLVLPARTELEVLVEPGQRVRAGESIVAELST